MAYLQSWLDQLPAILLLFLLAYTAFLVAAAVYNVTFHPLSRFPGPKLRGAFYFPQYWDIYTGLTVQKIKRLHDEYGDTVRISPTTLSYTNSQAWKDIYGNRQGKPVISKDKEVYYGGGDGVANIIVSNDVDHSRMRRLLSHAFSESALREQEPLITRYLDLLIGKLYDQARYPEHCTVDLVSWYNFTTFDILGDLCFDESFGALAKGQYHSWVANIFRSLKYARMFRVFRAYPIVGNVVFALFRLFPQATRAGAEHRALTAQKAEQRFERKTDRRDFMSYILRHNDEKGMTGEEIKATSGILIIAGSETTATLLSGATFHLLKNPSSLAKAVDEVRQAFLHASDITFDAVTTRLPYLNACLEETLRLYPPVPSVLPRRTGPEGDIINGRFIPPNISVGVHPWSAYLSVSNFKDPEVFAPERWLGDESFANDDLAACQPFSLGPRGCLGKNLAYAEMRSIMARILWNFDLELCDDSKDWARQKVFILWDKPALNVKLRVRKGVSRERP